ncbi:papain fold toxin domain-containing protein [Archangium sp.]|uniref:papain fold toxin domain-containing protein n=1 Tax=Archangium sp. TaxID=1872627 RepID=UPI0038998A07
MVLGLLLVAGLVPGPAWAASPASAVSPVRASVLAGVDSIRLEMMACLVRGDIAGAIALYEAETGQAAPAWLMELQGAYSVANQQAGKCQQVARIIHTAFGKLGQTPQYIAIRALGNKDYIAFDMASGKSPGITYNGYHAAVMIEDRVYDAYTGPMGMKLMDYMSRLHAELGVTWTVVSAP